MDSKTIALSAALIAALGLAAGLKVSEPTFAEMEKEVDAKRAADAKAKNAIDHHWTPGAETQKVFDGLGLDKKLLGCAGTATKSVCRFDGNNEVQFNRAQSAKIYPEIAAMQEEVDARVAAKIAEQQAEEPAPVEPKGEVLGEKVGP